MKAASRYYLDNPTTPIIREDVPMLVAWAIAGRSEGKAHLIALDGVDGSGKSTVAATMAALIQSDHLDLDQFLLPEQKNHGVFIGALDFARLGAAIDTLVTSNATFIVEGVCVLAALERLHISPNRLIYVRRRSCVGNYPDRDFYGSDEDAARERAKILTYYAESNLRLEVLDYHRAYRPFARAGAIYERVENGLTPAFIDE